MAYGAPCLSSAGRAQARALAEPPGEAEQRPGSRDAHGRSPRGRQVVVGRWLHVVVGIVARP
eukprot:2571886-Prymnesium_polylepis.1